MPTDGDLHGEFRPLRTRVVAAVLAAVTVVGTAVFVAVVPASFGAADTGGVVLLAVALLVMLWRQASVHATPTGDGLFVRNLVVGRRLEWAEVVSVRFGDRPWVQLDLADGDTLSVMGIQRSDGERSRREATRLATLVELHSQVD